MDVNPYISTANAYLPQNYDQYQKTRTTINDNKLNQNLTHQSFYNNEYHKNQPYNYNNTYSTHFYTNRSNISTRIQDESEQDPKHRTQSYFDQTLNNKEKQEFEKQKSQFQHNSQFDDSVKFRHYMEDRYKLEEEIFDKFKLDRTMHASYNRYNVLADPIRQKKFRFSYVQPNSFSRNFLEQKNQAKSQLETLKKYDFHQPRPNVQYKDERQKIEFEELQQFFDILKELLWTEIDMENQRNDIGKQFDFSLPDLYRKYFNKYLDKVKREEIRKGFHDFGVNISDEDLRLIISRFSPKQTENILLNHKEMNYEEFINIFKSKLQKYVFDHIMEPKRVELTEKTKNKITRYLRSLAQQEQQFESYRIQIQVKNIQLDRVYFGLTKYKDSDLSIHELYYFFLRNCMQVTFDQFKMFFERLDPETVSTTNFKKFNDLFSPKIYH